MILPGVTTTFRSPAIARACSMADASPSATNVKAELVDRLHVAIVPILLGRGVQLWDDLRGFEDGYSVTSEVASSGTTHLTFSR